MLRLSGVPIIGELSGCAGCSDEANISPTTTRTSTATATPTTRTTTTTDEPTTTEESTTAEESSQDAPGYKDSHWHGRLFFEINGTLVNFDQQQYYLDNIEDKHPEAIVNTPTEALKDFFGMGLDVLVLEDVVIEKQTQTTKSIAALQGEDEASRTMV